MKRGKVLTQGALAGVRVLDFTWVRAGPQSTRIMSMFGAEVIRIEWPASPDIIRVGSPRQTQPGVEPGLNTNADFNNFNCNKLSLILNVRDPAGLDMVKELISISDIVIENFSSRIMEDWGLSYEAMRAVNPSIVYVSMAGFGHAGPYRDYDTWGPAVQAITGLTLLSGLPDKPPAGWGHSYMDHTGGYYGAMAALTALHHRTRTGQGQYIDLAQVDAGCTMTGAAFLDYTVNGRSTRRPGVPAGNRTHTPGTPLNNTYRGPHAAPHNGYRCAPGGYNDWCTIACFTEEEWQGLKEAMGNPSWADDGQFATLMGRLEHQDGLDQHIEAWTKTLGKYQLMELLQSHGVPTGPVQGMGDRIERDPQLRHRGLFEARSTHPILGDRIFEGMPMKMKHRPWELWRYGPTMGEDNGFVTQEILGRSQEEIEAMEEQHLFWPRMMQRQGVKA